MDRYTFRGKRNQRATRARHGLTTRHGRPCPVPRLRSKSSPSSHAQLGWIRLIKETSVWLNGWSCDHLDQWVHLSVRSTATTIIPRPSWVSLGEGGSSHGLEVGWPHLEGRLHLPTAMTTKTDSSYWPSTTSGIRIRSVQVKRRWIIGSATPPHPAAPMKWAHALNWPHLPI
jgi:hypothetical protein